MPEEYRLGPIKGLYLPDRAWVALRDENIRTIEQLAAIAGQIERLVPGIGQKTADLIRQELTRLGVQVKGPGSEGAHQ